jgi:hypothetical protein
VAFRPPELEKYFILDLDYKILLPLKGEKNLKQAKRSGNCGIFKF